MKVRKNQTCIHVQCTHFARLLLQEAIKISAGSNKKTVRLTGSGGFKELPFDRIFFSTDSKAHEYMMTYFESIRFTDFVVNGKSYTPGQYLPRIHRNVCVVFHKGAIRLR